MNFSVLPKGLLIFLAATLLGSESSACGGSKILDPMPLHAVRDYIRKNCGEQKCQFQLSGITPFPWERLYFFDATAEANTVSRLTGAEYRETSAYYSRKWFFLEKDKIIAQEIDEIPNVDEPFLDGQIDIDLSVSPQGYLVAGRTAIFEVQKVKLAVGEFYRLRCLNCDTTPR